METAIVIAEIVACSAAFLTLGFIYGIRKETKTGEKEFTNE